MNRHSTQTQLLHIFSFLMLAFSQVLHVSAQQGDVLIQQKAAEKQQIHSELQERRAKFESVAIPEPMRRTTQPGGGVDIIPTLAAFDACPAVSVGPDLQSCAGSCVNLTANPVGGFQTTAYSISQIPYTPFPFTAGTQILVGTDDVWSGVITLPFTFCYFGNFYNQCVIGANGCVSFDLTYASQYNAWPINTGFPGNQDARNSICAPFHDTDPSVGGRIYYNLSGTAPCRSLTVTWYQIPMYDCNNLIATQQIVLYETTNIIETYIQNKPTCGGWNSGRAIHGIQDATATQAYVVPGRNSPTQWSASNDGWRFSPSGPLNYVTTWFQGATPIGTGNTVQVCPSTTTAYTASTTYTNCNNATVTVTDNITVNTFSISATAAGTSATCNAPGSLYVATTGGLSPFNYNIGSSQQNTPNFNYTFPGLGVGTYVVTITDALGCTGTATGQITAVGAPLAIANAPNNLTCNTTSVLLSGTGSSTGANLSYTWSGPGIISGGNTLSPTVNQVGTYTLLVTNTSNGCTASASTTVSTASVFSLTSSSTDNICNGGASGTVTVNVIGGTLPFSYNRGTGNQASNIFTNLAAGNYTITVTDGNGCTGVITETVAQPPAMTATAVQDSATCFGGSDGFISITVNGGSAPYSYNAGFGPTSSAFIDNLPVGNYVVTVTDFNGCTATVAQSIFGPPQVGVTAVQDSANCFGVNDGAIIVTPSGGTLPYIYNVGSGFQSSNRLDSLLAGTYTVTVNDGFGCSVTISATVLEPTALITSAVQDSATCFGTSTGSITATASGATPGYTYNVGAGAQASPILNNLAAGTYNLVITDFNACADTIVIDVLQPSQLTATAVQDSVTCFGQANGSITVTASGSIAPYSYNIGSGPQASNTFTGLIAGNYTVTITDVQGCTATVTQTVLQPSLLSATAIQDSVECFGGNDGSITVSVSTGTSPYTYNIGSGNQASNVFAGLTAGVYAVTVTDQVGCTATVSQTVLQPTALSATSVQDSVECFGGSDASITITATGGTLPYSYNLGAGAQTSNLLTGLTAGNYNITVTDGNACTFVVSQTVLQPTVLALAAVQDSVECFGGNDGSITVTASGGTLPYTYNRGAGVQASSLFTALTAGNYTITVTDGNGCTFSTTQTVFEPALLSASATQDSVNCFGGNDGIITVVTVGGTLPYSYNRGAGAQASNVFNGLSPGAYIVTITDGNGCTATVNQSIFEPVQIGASAVQDSVDCFGGNDGSITVTPSGGTSPYNYNIGSGNQASNVFAGLTAGNYIITVTDDEGCTVSLGQTVLQPTAWSASSVQDSVECFGGNDGSITVTVSGGSLPYSYNVGTGAQASNVLTNLTAGVYVITVTDGHACTVSTTQTVLEPTQLSATTVQDSVECFGGADGSITITTTGGTLPYSYNRGTGAQVSNIFSGLTAGTYTITVTDGNGCTFNIVQDVLEPTVLSATTVQDSVSCFGGADGSITVTATGGTLPYSYNRGSGAQASNIFTGLTIGTYTITVTDGNGCAFSLAQTVLEPSQLAATAVQDSVECFGAADGSITVTATGGTLPYSYNRGAGAQASNVLSGLSAGIYLVTVTDGNGCTVSVTETVLEPTALSATAVQDSVECFGGSDGSISVTATGGTLPYSYNSGSGVQASNIFTNLAAGAYTITVTDGNGCTFVVNQTVLEPAALSATAVQDSVECFGGADGSITVTTTGGTLPYSYNRGTGAQVSNIFSGLTAGTYTITVTDGNGCTLSIAQTVLEPAILSATTVQDSVSCFGGADGSITVTPTGGTLPYSYNRGSGAQASNIFTGLTIGTYTITVTDGNGCTFSLAQTVLEPTQLTATAVQDSVECFGTADGSITVTATGGTLPYSYNRGAGAQASNVLSGLSAGIYLVTVTDGNGCTVSVTETVLEPTALSATAVQDSVECFGGADGSITVTATGGTLPYSYNRGSGAQASNVFNNLAAGAYIITVTDGNSCTFSVNQAVLQPAQLNSTATQDSVNCFGGNDGSITVNTTGGTLPYSYNRGTGAQASNIFSSLTAGTYTITVTDGNACTSTVIITVLQPLPVSAFATPTPALCFGTATGIINAAASGGTAPYNYNIGSGNQSSTLFTGLPVGTYTLTVTDVYGCTGTASATITEPTALNAVLNATNVSCNGQQNGTVTILATGGTTPYSYDLGGISQSSNVFTNLAAGSYIALVTDANGCTFTDNAIIQQPAALNCIVLTTNVSCYGQTDGIAEVTNVTGGVGPYTYAWSDGNVGNFVINLAAGAYTVTITDQNACQFVVPFNIISPAPIQIFASALSPVTCNGAADGFISANPQGGQAPYVYNWSNGGTAAAIQNLSPGAYQVTVNDVNGCSAVSSPFTITEPTALNVSISVIDTVTCFGYTDAVLEATASGATPAYTYAWSNGVNDALNLNLGVGTYTVTATDQNNCTVLASVTLTQPQALDATVTWLDPVCFGDYGTITMLVDSTTGHAPYIYSVDAGLVFGSGNVADGLTPGAYGIVIEDLHGCQFTDQVVITEPLEVQVFINPDTAFMELGLEAPLNATVINAFGNVQLVWTPSTALSCDDCLSPIANPTENTVYTLSVTDANGCTASASTLVRVDPARNVYIPTAFSPNGDGLNDNFTVFGSNGVVQVERLLIADRWGDIVFDRSDFAPSDPSLGWDGIFKSKPMNVGTYVYYVEVLFEDGRILSYKGDFTLLR